MWASNTAGQLGSSRRSVKIISIMVLLLLAIITITLNTHFICIYIESMCTQCINKYVYTHIVYYRCNAPPSYKDSLSCYSWN